MFSLQIAAVLVVAALAVERSPMVVAFVVNTHHVGGTRRSTTTAGKTTSSLENSFRPLYEELCQLVGQKFGLQPTNFCDSVLGTDGNTWQQGGSSGTASWWSEASPNYLTGVTTATKISNTGDELYTLNVWMGPSYEVPHLLLTFGTSSRLGPLLCADYVPRGANVMGSDPQYLAAYYENPDVQSSWATAYSTTSGSVPLVPPSEFETRLVLSSPALIAVSGLSTDVATTLARQHVTRFLSWIDRTQPIPARLRGSFNMRDDKLRQYYFRGQCGQQVRELGNELGRDVAAANTGPIAEAYVGGGS